MLTSINPLGQRARGHRWGTTVALFSAASVVGGAMTGLALGALGTVLDVPVLVGALACAAAVLLDLTVVPTLRRQVDEDWLSRYRMWVYATGFGWQLGTGVVTIVTSAATYAMLALMLVVGLPGAAVAGAVFGLARALPLLAGAGADSPDRLRALAVRLEALRSAARLLTVGVLALGAALLAVA